MFTAINAPHLFVAHHPVGTIDEFINGLLGSMTLTIFLWVLLWFTTKIPINTLSISINPFQIPFNHHLSMGFPVFPWIFPWFSHGFPMVFQHPWCFSYRLLDALGSAGGRRQWHEAQVVLGRGRGHDLSAGDCWSYPLVNHRRTLGKWWFNGMIMGLYPLIIGAIG